MATKVQISESGRLQRHATLVLSAIVVLVLVCSAMVPGRAQVLYGSLTGNVTDQSGAFLPKAEVEALNNGTGVAQTAVTDANGGYRFSDLQSGNYRVTVKAAGFANAVLENVR